MAIKSRYNHPHISLCRQCGGKGYLSNYDEYADETTTEVCPLCQGSGRVLVSKTIQITINPYLNDTTAEEEDKNSNIPTTNI